MKSSGHSQHQAEDAAAEWLSRRDAGFTALEKAEFERWLSADRRHAAAVAAIAAAWDRLLQPRRRNRVAGVLQALARRRRLRRRRLFAAAVAGAGAMLGVFFFRAGLHRQTEKEAAPRSERQLLSDGSVVETNRGGEIALDFSPARRGVRLMRGEAHFSVAKDSSRPFVVAAGGVEVRAVGTEFDVRYAPREVEVLVTQGRVAVGRAPTAPAASGSGPTSLAGGSIYLSAGHKVVVLADSGTGALPVPEPVNETQIASELAWRAEQIQFDATSLAEAVRLFNSRNEEQLVLSDPALAAQRITGTFWSDDPAGFARLLESSLGIRAERRKDRIVLLPRD